MDHECIQCDTIKSLQIDLAVAKSDIQSVKEDVKSIKDDTKTSKNYSIATLITIVCSLIAYIIANMK